MLENDDDEAVQRLIDEGKAERYTSSDFMDVFLHDLQHDHDVLLDIKKLWTHIDRDPKLLKFLDELSKDSGLRESHLIIFTESKETANYLFKNLDRKYQDKVCAIPAIRGKQHGIKS